MNKQHLYLFLAILVFIIIISIPLVIVFTTKNEEKKLVDEPEEQVVEVEITPQEPVFTVPSNQPGIPLDAINVPLTQNNTKPEQNSVVQPPLDSNDIVFTDQPTPTEPKPCPSGFFRPDNSSGCEPVEIDVPNEIIQLEKPKNLKIWDAYNASCGTPPPLIKDQDVNVTTIRIMYYGGDSSKWPVYISNLKGDVVKFEDFTRGSTKCPVRRLVPRKYADVKIFSSNTDTYLIGWGKPETGNINSVNIFENIKPSGIMYKGQTTQTSNVSPEALEWLPKEPFYLETKLFTTKTRTALVKFVID